MTDLAPFIRELRALGVKRIELDLGDTDQALLDAALAKAVEAEPEMKAQEPGMCAVAGCPNPNGNSENHRMAGELCRAHWRQQQGIT